MGKESWQTLLSFGLVVVLFNACGKELPDYPARTPPAGMLDNPTAAMAGVELFRRNCATCHGRVEEGRSSRADFFQPPAPDFREVRYRQLPADYLYWRIATGKNAEPFASRGSVMPPWEATLREEDIWHLVAYLRSRGTH